MSVECNFFSACGPFTIEFGRRVLSGYRCNYRVAGFRRGLFDRLGVPLPVELENAVPERLSDYLAGRVCAQRLLQLLGFGARSIIPTGVNREPIWPIGVVGSISHSANLAVCVAAVDSDVLGVGIDIEQEIPPAIAAEISRQLVNSEEDTVIRNYFDAYNHGLTIVFSAKESFYKAAYPQVQRFFDFSAVRVVSVDGTKVVLSVSETLSDRFQVGHRIAVNYTATGADIQTVTCLTR